MLLLCSLLLGPSAAVAGAAAPPLVDADLFRAGQGGYACYRLPNLVNLHAPGHMLAIVQGHKFDCSDGGRMDILSRSSVDGGRTWVQNFQQFIIVWVFPGFLNEK